MSIDLQRFWKNLLSVCLQTARQSRRRIQALQAIQEISADMRTREQIQLVRNRQRGKKAPAMQASLRLPAPFRRKTQMKIGGAAATPIFLRAFDHLDGSLWGIADCQKPWKASEGPQLLRLSFVPAGSAG